MLAASATEAESSLRFCRDSNQRRAWLVQMNTTMTLAFVTQLVWRSLFYLWPLPNTLLGLVIGMIPFLGARSMVVQRGTLGIYGPGMQRLLDLAPIPGGAIAITLGHTILAANKSSFESSFEHEWIHVRQYLWWGPFFLPAYLLNSLWHWLLGEDMYLDNDFERQARRWGEGA